MRYGWLPDLPDQRDFAFTVSAPIALPPVVDLRAQCPAVYDQGQLGSCTANAIGGAIEYERLRQQLSDFVPSRLFIYYGERVIEHTVGSDSGAMIRDGMKVVAKLGAPPETDWPYDIAAFATKPPQQAYQDALLDQVVQYQRVSRSLRAMQTCLALGFPFVFGFTVYESFESAPVAATGVVPMPATGESVVGGHAVLAVGYDQPSARWIVRNSWGSGWGQQGYFTMPFAYLLDQSLASDFWTVRLVESTLAGAA